MLSRYNTADAASPNAPGAEWNQGCFFNNRDPYMQSATQTGTDYANGPFMCDIDECARSTDTCTAVGSTCTNTAGSFTCACDAGYYGDGTTAGTGCTACENGGAR